MVYADEVNLLEDDVETIKKNTETLTDIIEEVGLEVNVDYTKYLLMFPHKNAGKNWDIKLVNKSF
jgi:hypothetical protein